jgi:hypothetical protein
MSNYDNTNRGAIFKNENKTGSQPDYKGKINVDGVDKQISLWLSTSKTDGKKFFSVQITEPYQPQQQAQAPQQAPIGGFPVADVESDLPF